MASESTKLMAIKSFLKYSAKRMLVVTQASMEHRVNFFMITLASYGYNFMTLMFLGILFDNVDQLAGWSKYEVLVLYGSMQIIVYLFMMFFDGVDFGLAEGIVNSNLERFLLRPTYSFLSIISSTVQIFDSLPSIVLALGIVVYGLRGLSDFGTFNYLIYVLLLFTSVVFYTMFRISAALINFWTTDGATIRSFQRRVGDVANYTPLGVYSRSMKVILTTVLPVGLFAYVPVNFLIRGWDWALMINYVVVFFGFFVACWLMWRQGLKIYTSVGG